MDLIFTKYVRSLKPGVEPDAELFDEVWSTLRGALFHEMRRRSLLKLSPSFFGIYGFAGWSEEGAFEELTSDCYTFVFLERLPALKAQLEVKDNIEGLVFRSLRNFLHDAQKSNDPVGFKTYKTLSAAVARLTEASVLHAAGAGGRPTGDTVFCFSPALSPAESSELARDADLEGPAREWSDELVLGIVTARGKQRDEVVEALAERISRLPAEGIGAFRLKDLIHAVKGAVRVRWLAFGAPHEGEVAFEKTASGELRRVRIVPADTEVERRDSFRKLCAHVERNLAEFGGPRSRHELGLLWKYLKKDVAGAGKQKIPSRRQVARTLEISRHQLAAHFEVLGRWVHRYKAA